MRSDTDRNSQQASSSPVPAPAQSQLRFPPPAYKRGVALHDSHGDPTIVILTTFRSPLGTTAVCILLQHSSTYTILDFEHIPGVEVEATPSATRHESDSERDENAVIKVHMVVTFAPSSVTTEVKSAVAIHHKQIVQGLLGDIIGSNANNISVPDIRRGIVCCCGLWYHSQQRHL
ncbi:hypothetical protein CF319_g8562 [Tilletia indica]|nr:hypothetical protein CF319_g8562 [Tilletia indica]